VEDLMRIAIDALGISRPGGGRSATLPLLEGLFELDQQNEYLVVVDQREPLLEGHGDRVRQLVAPIRHRIAVRVWSQAVFPLLFHREAIDVVHFTKNLVTFFTPGRSVVTMYDMTIIAHPRFYPWNDVLYWRTIQRLALRSVDRIISISENTAREMMAYYALSRDKIRIIPCASHSRYRVLSREQVERVRARYGLPDEMIVHVGSIAPKKNLETLAEAFAMLVERDGYDGALVFVGRVYEKGHGEEIFGHVERLGLGDRVVFTGSVPDEDLPALYNAAQFMVFPSVNEGFGIVLLEAMACGCPVIASTTTALPEAVGDAGLLVSNPRDAGEIRSAMRRLLRDEGLRGELRAKGLRRAAQFSWKTIAQETLELYEELGSPPLGRRR
jgi:glycosyltransferase involved in cell wall biosynthesis